MTPGVRRRHGPDHLRTDELEEGLAEIHAAPLRGLRRLYIRDLPSVPIARLETPDLPVRTSAIYFLWSRSEGLVYLGRATDLRIRWAAHSWVHTNGERALAKIHATHERALELGDVRIHWWAIPREHLGLVEGSLLRIHRPPWNSCFT